jgi:PAS domain S-box-containing protein
MLKASDGGHLQTPEIPAALNAIFQAPDGFLEMLPVATFICDAHGAILQYNHRAAEIWGSAPQPGQTHDAFSRMCRYLEPNGNQLTCSLLTEVLRGGKPLREKELLVERHDGSRVFVSFNADPLRDGVGAVIGAVNCFTDITQSKRTDMTFELSRQHALEQEQRLAATYEHASIGISEVAPDGHFIRVNEAICAITGFNREYLLANNLFNNTHPDDIDADREAFRKQIAGALEFYSIEKRLVRGDGRIIWISVRSSPVRTADGRLLYVVRVIQDISERKAAERRQKLLIDELNHRVKNTLATVQSLAAQTARGTPSGVIEGA